MTTRRTTLVAMQAGVGLAVVIAAGETRLALLAALAAGSLGATRVRHAAPAAAVLLCLVAGVALMSFSSARRGRPDGRPCVTPAGARESVTRHTAQYPMRRGPRPRRSTPSLRGC
jgi:hypothetical protein